MKKFFNKLGGKDKAPKSTTEGDNVPNNSKQTYNLCYNSFDKNLSKLHQAAWNGDFVKVGQLAKSKNPSLLDKHNRYVYLTGRWTYTIVYYTIGYITYNMHTHGS